MCLTIPAKIILLKKNKAVVDFAGQQKIVNNNLIKPKIGDYVIIQNNTIIKKINKKEVKEFVKIFESKSEENFVTKL